MRLPGAFEYLLLFLCVGAFSGFAVLTVFEIYKLEEFFWLFAFFLFLLSMCVYAFVLTMQTEPGYLPNFSELVEASKEKNPSKRKILFRIDQLYWEYFSNGELIDGEKPPIPMNYALQIHENPPIAINFNECVECRLYKPTYDTSHCESCNRCVLSRDHHCHFLHVCIGERNRRQFIALLLSLSLTAIYSILILGYQISKEFEKLEMLTMDWTIIWWEIGFGILFIIFLMLKIFVFPRYFTYWQNFQILIALIIFGFGCVVMMTVRGHLPPFLGMITYLELCWLLFIGTNLGYQIVLVKKGLTVSQLAYMDAQNQEEEDLRRRLIRKASSNSTVGGGDVQLIQERSWMSTLLYAMTGFVGTDLPSFALHV